MLNYIKAELYRNFNHKYFWIYTGIFSIGALFISILFKSRGNSIPLSDMLKATIYLLSSAIFLLVLIIDMATAEEHKNNTIKNVISSGMPRSTFVLSKFIVTVILTFVWAGIILSVFYISGICMFGIGKGDIGNECLRILTSIPLFIGAISIGTFLAIIIENNSIFAFAYIVVFTGVSLIVKMLKTLVSPQFGKLYNVLITTQLGNFKNVFSSSMAEKAIVSGIVYTLIFLILSMIYFNRKEIK